MATRDTAQLILQVDAQVAAAQRSLNQLARSVNQDAANMEKSLDRVAQSHAKIGRALNDNGRIRSGLTQLSFQIGDVTQQMSLGVRASTIFAQQSGQVVQALQIMGGEGNRFLQFLGGPWGIAISSAAVILATLVPKLLENKDAVGDLVDKMREHARQAAANRDADELWKHTIEGLTEAIRKRREEQEKARQSDVTAQRESLNAAANEAGDQAKNLESKARELNAAVAKVRRLREGLGNPLLSPEQTASAEAAIAKAEADVRRLSGEVQGIIRDVGDAQKNIRGAQSDILKRQAEESLDPLKKTSNQISAEIDALTQKFIDGKLGPETYRKEVERLTKALKDAQEAAKKTASDNPFGRQIDFAEAANIARSAGLQVNSGYRSVAQQAALFNNPSVNRPGNPVAPPGASAHNGANGKWAIDIQITDGVTPGKIRKIFAEQGVSLTKVLKEKGHFHVEGSRSEAAKAENDAQRDAEREAKASQDRSQAFDAESDRINGEILKAKADLVQGEEAQADFAVKQLQADQISYEKALDRQVQDDKLNAIDAEALKLKHQQLTYERIKSVEQARRLDELKRADEAEQRSFQYQIDDLRFADDMAKSQAAHRQLQLEIIDIVYQQKEAHLKALKAELELAGKIEEAAAVQAEIDRLPTDKAHDRSRTYQATQSPLESYFDRLPHTADQINEALQNIEVQGIDGLVNALAHVGEGWSAMRDIAISALQDIASQLIRLGIQRMLFSLLGGAVLGPGAGAGAAGASFAASGADLLYDPSLLGLASGGFVSGPGGPTSDSIPAMLSNGEYVMSAAAVRKFGVGYLDMMNGGRTPHMKGGGLLGKLLPFFMGAGVGLLTGAPLPLLLGEAALSGGLFTLGRKADGPFGDILKFLGSPALFLGEELFKHGDDILKYLTPGAVLGSKTVGTNRSVPNVPNINLPKSTSKAGDTYNIHVVAPNTGDPLKDRQTGMQFAAGIEAGLAQRRAKGLVG